jgi:hypothetical protein
MPSGSPSCLKRRTALILTHYKEAQYKQELSRTTKTASKYNGLSRKVISGEWRV